ncbi:hypothetical protein DUNSADRAFT_6968, partial [Dunaliella salina]
MEQARQEHEQAKLQGCTFVPSISKMSAWITRHNLPAGRACLSQGQSLGSPGRGFTSPRPAAGSPGKSQRSSSVGGGSASTRTTPPRGPQQPPGTQVLDQEQSEAGQSTISLTSTERQERQAVFDRLYRQAAALEQRQQQRLEEERVEQQKRMFRARSPGTERIARLEEGRKEQKKCMFRACSFGIERIVVCHGCRRASYRTVQRLEEEKGVWACL